VGATLAPGADYVQTVLASRLLIRSVSQGGTWKVSNKLATEFPALAEAEVAENVAKAIREAFNAGELEGDGEESSTQNGR
jgi:hypothetical protein